MSLRIKDLPAQERPRERLLTEGAEKLSNAELIAILLRTGRTGVSVVEMAHHLLTRYTTLDQLSRASWQQLCETKGIGRDKAATLAAAFRLASNMAKEIRQEAPLLDSAERVADLLREENRGYHVEQLQVLLLNTRRRLIQVEKLSQGTLDSTLFHPREVFRSAILANAHALILVHNHPSGDPTPSEADIKATRDIIRAGQLLKIDVLDHVILGRRTDSRAHDWVSLREMGYFYS